MMQLGHKIPPAAPKTINEIAIAASKRFLCKLINNDFFFGPEQHLTPALKAQLDQEFRLFVEKNAPRARKAIWPLFIEHIADYIDAAFRLKASNANSAISWQALNILLAGFEWQDLS